MARKSFAYRLCVIFVLLVLVSLVGGCTAIRVAEEKALKAIEENAVLRNEIALLNAELEEKNVMTAKLQMELVQKRKDISQLNTARQGLVKEMTNTVIRTPAASTKVETVAYLAEITTEVEAARETAQQEEHEVFENADKLIAESNRELEREHFEQASLFAVQAMELINTLRFKNRTEQRVNVDTYEDFITPLELKVATRSNIRVAPGTRSRLVTTVEPGTGVLAAGHKGCWIKVSLADGRKGWVYYSLLSIPQELNALKNKQVKTRPATEQQPL